MTTALICARCGAVTSGAGPCPSCGADRTARPDAPPALARCPACGAPPPPAGKVACQSCGLPLPPPPPEPAPPAPAPTVRWPVVVVLALVGALVAVLLTRSGPPGPATAWRLSVGSAVVGRPVVDGGSVLVATDAGDLVAVDIGTGRARWRFAVGAPVVVGPGADGGIGYLVADSTLYAVDLRTGAERWRAEAVDATVAPVPVDGVVVVGGDEVVGYDAAEGAEAFRLGGIADVTGLAGVDEIVVVTTADAVLAVDTTDGSTGWQHAGPAAAGVTLAGDAAVVLTGDGEAVGYALATGDERWRAPATAAAGAVLADGDTIRALDPVTGRERWSAGGSPSILAAGSIVAAADGDRVTLRRGADGHRIGAVSVDDLGALAVGGTVVYAGTADAVVAIVPP